MGLDLRPAQTPLVGQGGRLGPLVAGQRRGHGGHHVDPVGTQGVVGHPGQEGRVSAAGEGHHDPVQIVQGPPEALQRRLVDDNRFHDQAQPVRVRTVSRSSTMPV